MKKTSLFTLLIFVQSTWALSPWLHDLDHPQRQQQIDLRWHVDGGDFYINFQDDLLKELGIRVTELPTLSKDIDGYQHAQFNINNTTSLDIQAPFGILESIPSGQLHIKGQFKWQSDNKNLFFSDLTLKASDSGKGVGEVVRAEIIDQKGHLLFTLDHIHTELDIKKQELRMLRMDVRISPWLAQFFGKPHMSNLAIAEAHMINHLVVPSEYISLKGGPTCPDDRPLWPSQSAPADVALVDMFWEYRRRVNQTSGLVFTPNAKLKNVGEADVVWQGKFTQPVPPYNNEQHPYLSWAMYREIDNRFEQIAVSGIKHAFFAQNRNCIYHCGSNFVLYKGCEDTYTVNNNDGNSYLGPRDELESFTGIWEQQCSFFDPDCNNTQNNISSTNENRLVVDESLLSDSSADYYFSSWYLIREDVDIFNSMGYRQYDLVNNQPSDDTWSLTNPSVFTNGPASDAYLTPNTTANNLMSASHRAVQAGEGHLTAAVKVVDLGAGLYRYNYMVENHDYDPQVGQIRIPLDDDASISDFVWSDIDLDTNNDWSTSRQANTLLLTAVKDNYMDWGELFSFSFTTNRPPEQGSVGLRGHENQPAAFSIMSLRPQLDDLIFEDGYEMPQP